MALDRSKLFAFNDLDDFINIRHGGAAWENKSLRPQAYEGILQEGNRP